jgi:hypothetical protein
VISIVSISSLLAGDEILFQGNLCDQQGLIFWNADGSGSEQLKIGHNVPFSMGNQPYYMATADFCNNNSVAGLSAIRIRSGFLNFYRMLLKSGCSLEDVSVKWDLYSLGKDVQGKDWWLNGSREFRTYKSTGSLIMQVAGEDMVGAPAPDMYVITDWQTHEYVYLSTLFSFEDRSQESSPSVKDLASVFLAEVAGKRFQFLKNLGPIPSLTCLNDGNNGRCGVALSIEELSLREKDDHDAELVSDNLSTDQESGRHLSIYPNPFNPATTISFTLEKAGLVIIQVYNVLGEEVDTILSTQKDAGFHQVHWNAGDLAAGVYMITLKTDDTIHVKRIMLLK